MTSSLVGSEMCIRDRWRMGQQAGGRCRGCGPRWGRAIPVTERSRPCRFAFPQTRPCGRGSASSRPASLRDGES
eukprot:11530537-Prorocentrum_lima.AAC.1